MLSARPIAVALFAALAVAGCGGDDDSNKNGGSEGSSAQLSQQDVAAKSNARSLVTEVEVCFVDQQSYAGCEQPEGTQLSIGAGPGQVEVSEATDTGYTIVAHSESGANFEIVKDESGETTRSCDKPGKGGCPAGGTW